MAARDCFPTRLEPLPRAVPADLVIDELLALRAGWRREAAAAEAAYRRWIGAPSAERARRHAAYLAALDQEAEAATHYDVIGNGLRASIPSAYAS
jgi:hypothetical protein